jgi:hypothetical protein
MIITDRLFKSCIFKSMKEITVEAVVHALIKCLIQYHEPFIAIVSDKGPQFVSLIWKRICSIIKISKRLSTAFYSETNGSIERMNQKLKAYLRYFVSYYQNDWEQFLPIAILAINGRTSSVTGFSPFFATHSYDIKPIKTKEPLKIKGITPIAKKKAFISKLKNVTKMAQIMIAAAQEKYEIYSNMHR